MLSVEAEILRSLGYVGHVEHPHKFVISLLSVLGIKGPLMQEVWSLTNDRCYTLPPALLTPDD